ncbi:MAG: type IV secretion system DNA-binding domain-containing protein, partial [bacterium]|nr:type IV secretion system DNA-binding domain-containing protein [bacterium]
MGWWNDFLVGVGIIEPKRPPAPKPEKKEPVIIQRVPNPDELALGFAQTENADGNEEWVLKGVLQEHRSTHFYVVGASGSGKTKFLESLAKQDIENDDGLGIIDAHGDLTEDVKGYLYLLKKDEPDFLRKRVILIDPTDPDNTVCFNVLEKTEGISPAGVASELVEVFKKIWKDSWGARMEDLLKNTLIALIENDLTLAEVPLFLTDFNFRKLVLEKVKHPISRQYFERFDTLAPHTRNEWIESTLNKVNAFLSDDNVRQMFVSPKSTFNLRDVMDDKKILLVKLDRGHLKGNADLLGALLLAKIQMAAFSRTDIPASKRVPFYLYIDEFQNFATESFTEILAEARKYKLSLILAHQNLAQLSAPLRASILSNCGLQAY